MAKPVRRKTLQINGFTKTILYSFIFLNTIYGAIAQENVPAQSYQQQITELTNNVTVKRAIESIPSQNKQNLDDLITLTEIPAPPFGEEKRAIKFASMLSEAGLKDVTIDQVGNVIGRRPGLNKKRVIAIAAHVDTVFPIETDVKVKKQGGKYFAPGIGDNSRGLVVLLSILRTMQTEKIVSDADILFIGNVGEEGLGDLRGVKYLFREGAPKIDAFIAIDGGRNNRLVHGGVGSHRYRLSYSGPGGHSWGAFGMVNPHHALGRAIAEFDKLAPSVTTQGDKTSYNIGRIGGGTSINSIPFESWAEIDMRSGNQQKLDEIDAVLHVAAEKGLLQENQQSTKESQLVMKLERIGTRPAGKANPSQALIQQTMAAMWHIGIEPRLAISSTDANIPISLGVPAITLSRGGIGGRAHSLDEWWQNKDSHISIQIALLALLAQAGVDNDDE